MGTRTGTVVLKNAIAYCRREMRYKAIPLREPYADAIDIMTRLLLNARIEKSRPE